MRDRAARFDLDIFADTDRHTDLIFLDFDSLAGARRWRPQSSGTDTGGTTTTTTSGSVLTSYHSGNAYVSDAYEYNIDISFQGSWTLALQQAFITSANAISSWIFGDVQNVWHYSTYIDDLTITAQLVSIDGTGGILGQSGPTAIRTAGYLPAVGVMQFDSADAAYYNSIGLFDDIVLHEMLHVVGFGTIWSYLGLVAGAGTSAPVFLGWQANAAYPSTSYIPVENSGGAGTANVHWAESVFGSELMTGYIESNNDLSYTTIASLGDLGYSVISGASYVPPSFV
jgi:hypothetical protein